MKKKSVMTIIVLSGLGILFWQIYQKGFEDTKTAGPKRRQMPVAVEASPVRKDSIREMGHFTGSLHPLSEFVVAPKIAGRLESLQVNIGDIVKTGQLVAMLDKDEYSQQVIQSEAELAVARANFEERRNILENAQREFERTRALRKKKIASESQLDAAESEFKIQQAKLKVASAQIAQREAALKAAEIRASHATIKVPENLATDYVVGERFVDEGAMLAPNTPIVSILNIEKLIVVTHVAGRDYPKINKGQTAFITADAFPRNSFKGKVVRIAPVLKEKSREARVEIEMTNEDRLLKPGMFVTVEIEFDVHDNVTVVPVAALVKRNDVQGVFIVGSSGQKARFVPVKVGFVEGLEAEIIEPDIKGQVVTLGHHLLEDGQAIVLPEQDLEEGKEKS